MCGYVVSFARAVAVSRDDLAVAHDHRTHGYLAARPSRLGLPERQSHETRLVAAHLASEESL
jgi:hypothetical protein